MPRRPHALAFILATLALGTSAARGQPPAVTLDGLVGAKLTLDLTQLKSLPPHQVEASFGTMHGTSHHVWTGVLLWDLVNKAGLRDEPGKRTSMRHVLLVHGADGYAAALAIGEIDPAQEGKQVILAYGEDDTKGDLPGLHMIVPGDRHGARDVRDVVEIEVR